jgi:predicted acylesterase/phospholipase RssA
VNADLVLEGGGVKGIGLVGAYPALEEAGYTFRSGGVVDVPELVDGTP